MKASVSGASSRLDNSTGSGRPVEWIAEQITGTPASHAASRPQNILSPRPTVTTASTRRRRISRASRGRTMKSYLWRSRPAWTGISATVSSRAVRILSGSKFRQESPVIQAAHQVGQERFGPAYGHARQHEHDPHRATVFKRNQAMTVVKHGYAPRILVGSGKGRLGAASRPFFNHSLTFAGQPEVVSQPRGGPVGDNTECTRRARLGAEMRLCRAHRRGGSPSRDSPARSPGEAP